jgi:hypothetical protein
VCNENFRTRDVKDQCEDMSLTAVKRRQIFSYLIRFLLRDFL